MSRPGWKLGKLTRRRTDGSTYWSYCVLWHQTSGRVRKTLDTQDKVIANAKAAKLWSGRTETISPSANTVGACVTSYLDSHAGNRDETRKRAGWQAAQGFWNAVPVDLVDDAMSRAYLEWRGKAVNTMRNELSLVRAALSWAYKKDAPRIIVPGMPPSKVGHLSKAQFREFLTGCASPHVKLFAILGVTTGARKSALLEAKWEQVDWDREQLNLNAEGRVQSHKRRAIVPLNGPAMAALREAKEGATSDYIIEYHCGPIADIKKGVAAAVTRTGVKVHPHMFRHSAAVWMAEDRVPMAEISAFLGHDNLMTTTRVYARFNPDFLRGAADALTW